MIVLHSCERKGGDNGVKTLLKAVKTLLKRDRTYRHAGVQNPPERKTSLKQVVM
jgi:hypothetical protein